MQMPRLATHAAMAIAFLVLVLRDLHAQDQAKLPKATIDGTGPEWRAPGEEEFVNVNCDNDTWTWKDGVIHCTGQPVGVMRLKKPVTNFELVVEWMHERPAGNSGSLCVGARKIAGGARSRQVAPRNRGAGARQRLCRAVREAKQEETGFLLHARRRVSCRHVEDEAVPADFAQRPAELSQQEPQPAAPASGTTTTSAQSTAKCGCG